jgi:hypothetical protein
MGTGAEANKIDEGYAEAVGQEYDQIAQIFSFPGSLS